MYKVGSKVICLTNNWSDADCNTPIKGRVYTIRGIREFIFGGFGLTLEEIRNITREYSDGIHEVYFWYNNFRLLNYDMDINYEILEEFKPIEERADIEMFKPRL